MPTKQPSTITAPPAHAPAAPAPTAPAEPLIGDKDAPLIGDPALWGGTVPGRSRGARQ